jgi:dihydroorotate dehydrogenase (fumarate)
MGLKLRNPLVVASCSLSKNLDGIRRLADAGAGAIVLKSLFEEQIQKEIVEDLEQGIGPNWHYEAYDYVSRMGMELGPQDYLKLIEKAKKLVPIPRASTASPPTGGATTRSSSSLRAPTRSSSTSPTSPATRRAAPPRSRRPITASSRRSSSR